jgi:hypothetical protein
MTNRNGETQTSGSGAAADSDDWESMLDSGQLDKSLEQLTMKTPPLLNGGNSQQQQQPSTNSRNSSNSSAPPRPLLDDPFFSGPVRILTHDGSAARTQYRPPEPQLKILKRPTADNPAALAKKAADSQQVNNIGAACVAFFFFF